MLQWISATLAVILLILVIGRLMRWVLQRSLPSGAAARTRAHWRVAADVHVRAVEVLGRIFIVYDRGRSSTLLESLEEAEFEKRLGSSRTAPPSRSLRQLWPAREGERANRRVAGR